MKNLLRALACWIGRNRFTIKPQVSPVCRGDGGFLLACADKNSPTVHYGTPVIALCPVPPCVWSSQRTSQLARSPTADGVFKETNECWPYQVIDSGRMGNCSGFSFCPLSCRAFLYGNRGEKSPLLIASYRPKPLTNKEGISPGFSLIWRS